MDFFCANYFTMYPIIGKEQNFTTQFKCVYFNILPDCSFSIVHSINN